MATRLDPAAPHGVMGRDRLLTAALKLFAEHGVSGTSLQMIADALGVTKAAIYYHFKTKGDIVLALVCPALEELTEIADEAERKRSRAARADTILVGLVDLIIKNRSVYAVLQGDLTVARILDQRDIVPAVGSRLVVLLAGPDPEPDAIVAASMVLGGLRDAGFAPAVRHFSDEELRACMLACARRLLRGGRAHRAGPHCASTAPARGPR